MQVMTHTNTFCTSNISYVCT